MSFFFYSPSEVEKKTALVYSSISNAVKISIVEVWFILTGLWQTSFTNTSVPDVSLSVILSALSSGVRKLLSAYVTLRNMSTIRSSFPSWLITSYISSVLPVFCRYSTWIALGDVDLRFSHFGNKSQSCWQPRDDVPDAMTDGVTVTSLATGLQHKTRVSVDRICHIALDRKLPRIACAKSREKRRACVGSCMFTCRTCVLLCVSTGKRACYCVPVRIYVPVTVCQYVHTCVTVCQCALTYVLLCASTCIRACYCVPVPLYVLLGANTCMRVPVRACVRVTVYQYVHTCVTVYQCVHTCVLLCASTDIRVTACQYVHTCYCVQVRA